MISILLYLYKKGDCLKGDIYADISTNPRIPAKLDILEEHGLITQSVDVFHKNATTLRLTDKGHKVSEELMKADELIIDGIY